MALTSPTRTSAVEVQRPAPRRPFRTALRGILHRLGYEIHRRPVQVHPLGPHLQQLFEQQEINCVLDVGAHYGEYAQTLRRLGYRGRIVSFEPLPESYAILQEASANDPEWHCHNVALGDTEGEAQFHVTRNTVFCSLLEPNSYSSEWSNRESTVERVELVRVSPLERMLDECTAGIESPRVFLKMDTQGADVQVLRGAGRALDAISGLQSEVSVKPLYKEMPSYDESIRLFREYGFELTGLFPCAQEEDLRVIEFDCVMVKGAAKATE